MPQPIALTFTNLTRLANAGDGNIVVKNGGFKSTGKLGAFFTAKAAHRAAAETLLQGVRQRYGDAVADALAPDLRSVREQGKPLSARTARDALAKAADMAQGLVRVNTDMARHFIMGNAGPGDTRNLEAAFREFCAARGLDPAAHQELKTAFGEAVAESAASSTTVLSFAELSESVRTASLPGMKRELSILAAGRFMADADPEHGVDAATDACAARLGLDAGQKESLRALVGMSVPYAAENATEEYDAQYLFNAVSSGSLPGMDNFAYGCGKLAITGSGAQESVKRDTMAWATPATMADIAMLEVQLRQGGGAALNALATQRLPDIRRIQPEGLPGRDALWQGCFNEAMPEALRNIPPRQFNSAMFDRLARIFQETVPDNPAAAPNGMTTLSTGISLEKTLESLRGPVTLTLADFSNLPSLTPLSQLGTLEEVETSLAKDLCRRGTHNALPGYAPVVSFGVAGGEAETVHIQDTSAMDAKDKENFEQGKPSSMSRRLADRALRLCNGNEAQARQVIQSMGQSGAFLVRSNSPVTGIFESEHSPLDIDIRREEDGSITMRFYKPEQSPLDIDYTYTVTPDGQGMLTACRIQARQSAAGQPA